MHVIIHVIIVNLILGCSDVLVHKPFLVWWLPDMLDQFWRPCTEKNSSITTHCMESDHTVTWGCNQRQYMHVHANVHACTCMYICWLLLGNQKFNAHNYLKAKVVKEVTGWLG